MGPAAQLCRGCFEEVYAHVGAQQTLPSGGYSHSCLCKEASALVMLMWLSADQPACTVRSLHGPSILRYGTLQMLMFQLGVAALASQSLPGAEACWLPC